VLDVYEDALTPNTAAHTLLLMAAAKRPEALQKMMDFIIQVLNTPNLEPQHKSGAMHMIVLLREILLQVNTWHVFDCLLMRTILVIGRSH